VQVSDVGCLDCDVAIVGAGPVGLLLANLLGARGVRTALFDKRVKPQQSSMAIGVTPPSLEILKRLGLDGVFRDAGIPVRHAEVYEARTRVGRLDFAGIPSEYPFFLSLPQAKTIEILRNHLAGTVAAPSSGSATPLAVAVFEGAEFVSLRQDEHAVHATFWVGETRKSFSVRARFLVGADGHRSAVRNVVGIGVSEKTYPQRFVMADFEDDTGLGPEARLFFTPSASVESFPLPGGSRRWIVQIEGDPKDDAADHLVQTVRQLTGFDLGRRAANFVSTFGAKRMVVDRYHVGRVLLAGDAAHVMSSIGGQGMNTGFADSEMLAEILPAVLADPTRMARCFESYDRIRRHSFEVAAARAERGMWLGTLRGKTASWFRKHLIRDVLFGPLMERHLAPYFAMLTIPYRNLNHVPARWLAAD
jgi:2-polyprenyl-6-methoxyphenol hydroxylase-like FAD-dependent oxidoreductase